MFFYIVTIWIKEKTHHEIIMMGFFITSFLLHPRAASDEWLLLSSFVFSQMVL